jgi:PTS system nitrogen regulatory IIA component
MRLVDLLSTDRIDTALVVDDKPAALRAMAALLSRGAPELSEAQIVAALQARERTASTGVGEEVAVPHGRVAGLSRLVAAMALTPHGVEFESIDGRPVRILVSVIAPERATGDHVRALASVARLLHDASSRARLLDAHSADEVMLIVGSNERV